MNRTTNPGGSRRLAMAAATILLAGAAQLGCYVEPPPVAPAPAPAMDPQAQPADGAQAPADGQQDDATLDDFYEPLAAYGTWVDTESYGKVWQPAEDVAGEGFMPYGSDGSWANNDDGDYVFQSKYDSQYGWATYHYGRWAEHDDYGWVWIPGTVWAPSWVEWRYGGGYVGWVPMGPPGYVVVENRWFFTEERYFGAPNVYAYRFGPERIHGAYLAASPLVEVHGRGGWRAGPPGERLRASGVVMRTAHGRAPARGYVKAQATAVKAGATARAGRPASPARTVRNNPTRAPQASPPPQPHPAAPSRVEPHHETAKPPAAPPPKPKPAPAAPPPKRGGGGKKH